MRPRRIVTGAVAAVLIIVLGACRAESPPVATSATQADPAAPGSTTVTTSRFAATSLQGAADRHGLVVGVAVDPSTLDDEPDYARTIADQFGMLTPENQMKWSLIHPRRAEYDFAAADEVVDFAERHGQAVHGHTLAWHLQNPDWLVSRDWTRDELVEVLRDHITTVVGRYRGRVAVWDVVNEAVEADGSLRRNLWTKGIGDDYIALAFRFAHEADPAAKLYYNDYGTEGSSAKTEGVFALMERLRSEGVPVDGIGFQSHLIGETPPPAEAFAANLARAADLGLDSAITELDVALKVPAQPGPLEAQARAYGEVATICVQQPRCRSFTTWGVTDRHSWVPSYLPGAGAALPYDEDLRPKPARAALQDALDVPARPRTG